MTVMFEPFFGVPQSAVRNGKLKDITGSASKLYLVLCHDSERNVTRELRFTLNQLRKLTGLCLNTVAKARDELVKAGLVHAQPYGVEGYVFALCDPDTGRPWPLHPREPFKLPRKNARPTEANTRVTSSIRHRKPPKMEIAGSEFPFGANSPEERNAVRKGIESATQEPSLRLRWEDIGTG